MKKFLVLFTLLSNVAMGAPIKFYDYISTTSDESLSMECDIVKNDNILYCHFIKKFVSRKSGEEKYLKAKEALSKADLNTIKRHLYCSNLKKFTSELEETKGKFKKALLKDSIPLVRNACKCETKECLLGYMKKMYKNSCSIVSTGYRLKLKKKTKDLWQAESNESICYYRTHILKRFKGNYPNQFEYKMSSTVKSKECEKKGLEDSTQTYAHNPSDKLLVNCEVLDFQTRWFK